METRYVSWQPGKVAAVRMTRRTPFFDRFAASIRHRPTSEGHSEVTYVFNFKARPRWLAWLLEPVMNWVMRRETHARLLALADALDRSSRAPDVRHPRPR